LNYPTRDEKIAMASSIINAFPVLKDASLPNGYVSITFLCHRFPVSHSHTRYHGVLKIVTF